MIFWLTGRFARESFRQWVVSPVGHFALGRFVSGSFLPNLVGRFAHIFIQALWIEVRYDLVYKEVEGAMGSRCAFGYICGLFIQYLCYTETDELQECTTQTLFKDSLTIR